MTEIEKIENIIDNGKVTGQIIRVQASAEQNNLMAEAILKAASDLGGECGDYVSLIDAALFFVQLNSELFNGGGVEQ